MRNVRFVTVRVIVNKLIMLTLNTGFVRHLIASQALLLAAHLVSLMSTMILRHETIVLWIKGMLVTTSLIKDASTV